MSDFVKASESGDAGQFTGLISEIRKTVQKSSEDYGLGLVSLETYAQDHNCDQCGGGTEVCFRLVFMEAMGSQ